MESHDLDPALTDGLVRLGGRDLLVRMIDAFALDAPARRQALQGALAGPDLTEIARTSHAIVAGAGQLGATRLSVEARTVEEAARQGHSDEVRHRIPALIERYDAALTALAQLREQG